MWNIAQVFVDDESKISKFNPLEKERKLCQWFEEEKIGKNHYFFHDIVN